jgi:hypothetical protein
MVDGEKIKWMIQRKKRLDYTDPRFQDILGTVKIKND